MTRKDEVVRIVKRIFIASPGDLRKERKQFPRILEKINKLKAHGMGVHLEAVGWEEKAPGMGRPQEQINKDVETCNLFVMLLWKRWGTPPDEKSQYSSGTEEEYYVAKGLYDRDKAPDIYLYFRQVPEAMMADPGEQLRKVLDFRKKIEAERVLLFKQYNGVEEWEDMLMEHIARWLDGFQPAPPPTSAPIPLDVQQRIEEMEKELSKLADEHKDAQTRLREAALEMGRRALVATGNGQLTEAEELFARAVQTYTEPWVINAYGLYYRQIGSLKRAEEKFLEVERLGKEQDDKEHVGVAYGNLGLIYQTRGDLNAAERMHRKALTLSEELGRKEGMAGEYANLGLIYQTRGDVKTAEEMHRKSLALDEELGRKEGMARDYNNLGLVYQTRGDLDTAEEVFRKALALFEELRDKDGMATAYGNLGLLYHARGEVKPAEEMYRKALALFEELGQKDGMATAYGNLGLVYQTGDDLTAAEEMHRKALALDEILGRKEGMARQYGNLGLIQKARGDLNTAEEMYRKALALNEELGRKQGMALQYYNLGLVYRDRGDLKTAEMMLGRALSLFEEVGDKPHGDWARGDLLKIQRQLRAGQS